MEAVVDSKVAFPSFEEWMLTAKPMAGGAPTLDELKARNDEIQFRIVQLNSEASGRNFTEAEREEWNNLNKELEANEEAITEGEAREAWIAELEQKKHSREQGAHFGVPAARSSSIRENPFDMGSYRENAFTDPETMAHAMKDGAKRAIEEFRFAHPDVQNGRVPRERVQEHLTNLLEMAETERGDLSKYLLQAGSPLYKRAFGKYILGQGMTSDETRALAVASGSSGGYAVPITLDPTLIPTSNGVVNPLRAVGRVETIVGLEYRGLTTGAVVASYAPEGTEATDNAPTLAQPDIFVERAQAFIPYSVEIGMDWAGLQAGMAKLIQDAKDVLEGTKFTLGAGHTASEPAGLLTGATQTVYTAASASFAVADLYSLEQALPPRFRPQGQFFANRAIYNLIRQFGASANQNLWMPIVQQAQGPLGLGLHNTGPNGDGNLGMKLLGYGSNEVSDMGTALGNGNTILTIGDPSYFLIVDRIGMTIEMVPQLFGPNRRPTGQRGIYAYWRNTSTVVDPNAFRSLVTL